MSDEIFALMEAADTTQKAAQALVEKAEKQTRAAQAAIAKLDALPAAVTSRITGEIAKAIKEAASETTKNLDNQAKRLQMVGAWWPLIFAVLFLTLFGVLFYAYEAKKLNELTEVKAEIQVRRAELARTPKVVRYTDDKGNQYFGVEVTEHARPMKMTDGTHLIDFK